MLELIVVGSTVFSCVSTVLVTYVIKNRDDNALEREKLNVEFLRAQSREEDEHTLKERVRSVVYKLNARDRRQLLLGDGNDIGEVRRNMEAMLLFAQEREDGKRT